MKKSTPNATHFDLIVIGSGPAGQRAALQAAKSGKTAAIVEKYPLIGGGCVHFGTLPSKSFRESVYRYSLGSRGVLGREESSKKTKLVVPEMQRLLRRKDRVIADEVVVIGDQLKRNGVAIFEGEAHVSSFTEVIVTLKKKQIKLTGEKIMIATGARPVPPPHLGVDGKFIFDSDTILNLKKVPKSMIVLGAGVIGCEYASMFSMAGTHVTLVDKRDRILGSVDTEIVEALRHRFEFQGMDIVLCADTLKIEVKKGPKKKDVVVHLKDGKKLKAETVLIAMGRFGNTEGLGLRELGIEVDDRGLVKVDSHFRTNVPNIYAVGDVIGAPALAATAMEQGRIACCHAFNITMKTGTNAVETEHEMPKNFPFGIYTIPEISMIGKTEEDLRTEGVDFVIGRSYYKELARGQIVGDRWGLLKLIVARKNLKLLSVHIVGDNAADLIHIGQAVMAYGGDVTYFINSVFNYPTLAEAYKVAAFNAVNVIKGRTKSTK